MDIFKHFRFSHDDPNKLGINLDEIEFKEKNYANLRSLMMNSVKITESIFPKIYKSINNVYENLKINRDFSFFVTANHIEANASCISSPGSDSAEIILTSKLIEILSPEELEFVISHELSHFFLKHNTYPSPETAKNKIEFLNYLSFSRFAEISSDRLGFIGCKDLNVALRAIFKLITGLGDEHIKFNISSYLDQYREIKDLNITKDNLATHPSFFTRMQALIWFSMTEEYLLFIKSEKKGIYKVKDIDEKIFNSLNTTSGYERENLNKELYSKCLMWGSLKIFLFDGNFSKREQDIFEKNFGKSDTDKIKSLLNISSKDQIENKINTIFTEGASLLNANKKKLYDEFIKIIDVYAETKNKQILQDYFKVKLSL